MPKLIIPNSIVQTKFDQLPTPTLAINERLTQAKVPHWKTQPTILRRIPPDIYRANYTPPTTAHSAPQTHHLPQLPLILPKIWHLMPRLNVLQRNTNKTQCHTPRISHGAPAGNHGRPNMSETQRCYIMIHTTDVNILLSFIMEIDIKIDVFIQCRIIIWIDLLPFRS